MTDNAAPMRLSRRDLELQLEELARENAKLRIIRDALMNRVDRGYDPGGKALRTANSVTELEASVEKRIQRLARAMSEAKIARRQLQQAIDSINEGFILYDQDDLIVLCNRKYRTLFPELADILHPGTGFIDIIRKAAEVGVVAEAVTDPQAWIAARVEHHRQDWSQFQQLLSDGRWIQISDRKTDEGGTVTIVSDITHFKRLEETRRLTQLADQKDLLVWTVASIAQGVVVFDKDLRLVAWNSQAAMLLNLPYVEMHPGMGVRELAKLAWRHGARLSVDRKREVEQWINSHTNRYPLRLELMFPGGRCVAANFRDMPDDGFVVTMTDVTAQLNAARLLERSKEQLEEHVNERTRQLQQVNATLEDEIDRHKRTAADLERMRSKAEAANMSKTRFLAAASHDLLQPLNAARLYLSALETSPLMAAGARELLDHIIRAFGSIESLLNTLLDISKMDAGGYQPNMATVDLGEMLDALRTEFGPAARQKGLRLRFVGTSTLVRSDARLLRSIVQNLISNAVKYTDSGSVLVGVRRRGAMLSLEIIDTGLGIAPEHHQAIFEEFKRLNPATARASGLGLGLATAKRAADLLGYSIELQSDLGAGARFSLLLPWQHTTRGPGSGAIADGQPRNRSPAERSGDHAGQGLIFVLENDAGVANAMATLFDHWQLRSVTAASYALMRDLIEREGLKPRMIIADLHLDDDIDGVEAIRLLRQRYGMSIPGILVTADQSREVQERAKAQNIEYFSKPVKPAQLRAFLFHLDAGAAASPDRPISHGA